MVRLRASIGPSINNSRRYSRANCAQLIRKLCPFRNSRSLGARDGIQTSYRLTGTPRPRKRVARMRTPSFFRLIGLQTDFVRMTFVRSMTTMLRGPTRQTLSTPSCPHQNALVNGPTTYPSCPDSRAGPTQSQTGASHWDRDLLERQRAMQGAPTSPSWNSHGRNNKAFLLLAWIGEMNRTLDETSINYQLVLL